MKIDNQVIERIYAGWLGKIIGIRLGAPVENWSYERIAGEYGEITDYVVDYTNFGADDDSNGPIFLIRALEANKGGEIGRQDVAEAILNYAAYEQGFFWWGGYGISTEHTAYLNLYHGVPADLSGSIAKNGLTAAEQIGGQIFIDTWGLVCPGDPDRAAVYADLAAGVMHDGNGRCGGIFVAVCISCAFVENRIDRIIQRGLSYLPPDAEYVRVLRAVIAYYEQQREDWRAACHYVREHFGYDRYPGNCHIIPNSAMLVLSLLYGEGDFSRTITIGTMCGWDTDCNVGNAAAILGVMTGVAGIDERWRQPVNDLLINSSVVGSLNCMDIPYGASYLAGLACLIQEQEVPADWRTIFHERIASCHFEYPGSTHAMRGRRESGGGISLENSCEQARTGQRSLKVTLDNLKAGERAVVYKKTYYLPQDFDDSRYDPSFSPLLYPGQTVSCGIYVPPGPALSVGLYTYDRYLDEMIRGESTKVPAGQWRELRFTLPVGQTAMLLEEVGVEITADDDAVQAVVYLDDLDQTGAAEYLLDFTGDRAERWPGTPRTEVSQFTRYKGFLFVEKEELHLSGTDVAAAYTGKHDWRDYQVTAVIRPELGEEHLIAVRVQGAARHYGAGFVGKNRIGIVKNHLGITIKASCEYPWEHGMEYRFTVVVKAGSITLKEGDRELLSWQDEAEGYGTGGIGLITRNNGHLVCKTIRVMPERGMLNQLKNQFKKQKD